MKRFFVDASSTCSIYAQSQQLSRRYGSIAALLLLALFNQSCTSVPSAAVQVETARIAGTEVYEEQQSDSDEVDSEEKVVDQGFTSLQSLNRNEPNLRAQQHAIARLSSTNQLEFAAEQMPVEEFIHSLLGEVLKLNYVVVDGALAGDKTITLNVQQAMSSRELYMLASQLLDQSGISIRFEDEVYFVVAKDPAAKGGKSIGIGRSSSSVPMTAGPIMQIVPIRYGMGGGLERTLLELINGSVLPDFEKNVMFITAERNDILKALDLIDLLDTPANRGRHVGILKLTYVNTEDFLTNANKVLVAEGIPMDTSGGARANLVLVPLEQIGSVAVFASEQFYIDRLVYWAKQIDKPSDGAEQRYYVFYPKFARAADLGASIAGLLGESSGMEAGNTFGNSSRDTSSAFDAPQQGQNTLPAASQSMAQGAATSGPNAGPTTMTISNDRMRMTVDERSNTLIFYTTGFEYQNLLPMIKRLDVMPKQILLEATIAEVTLTDDLSMGLEFALQQGRFGASTKGAFGVSEFGGLGLSFIDGADQVLAQLKASRTKVNVISSPSIVVRDGVSANIAVGTDIPTVGSTTVNPGTETQSTTVQYRKTGVELTVTPTINAQGLVVLQISQSISNTVDGGTIAGSPSIFERSIDTEVLAQSGQTVLLGGLMSENTSKTETKVPGFGDLPLIGYLFRGQKDSVNKTELILMITPRVIDQPGQWQQIRSRINNGMQNLKIAE